MGASTRHLVLVGDRVAVRPGGPVARLSRTFRLDVSLFELLGGVLLRGGVEHASLTAQRRLPPAITRLLLPVYPTLSDHPSTLRRLAVAGVERPVFFLAHERPEGLDPETGSRTNAHEAKFVAALAAYLLRQGYAPPQLAVVSPYCGQRRLIKQCLAEAGAAEVRAASVDHIDEADVVLLSLVRSNDGAKLGLLEEELLACRAVSRARLGLYVVGNAKMLYGAENGGLWEGMLKALKQADATGNFARAPRDARRSAAAAPSSAPPTTSSASRPSTSARSRGTGGEGGIRRAQISSESETFVVEGTRPIRSVFAAPALRSHAPATLDVVRSPTGTIAPNAAAGSRWVNAGGARCCARKLAVAPT